MTRAERSLSKLHWERGKGGSIAEREMGKQSECVLFATRQGKTDTVRDCVSLESEGVKRRETVALRNHPISTKRRPPTRLTRKLARELRKTFSIVLSLSIFREGMGNGRRNQVHLE